MEEKVCMHQKFGRCKFNKNCTKKHLEETCQDLSAFINKVSTQKRHPKGSNRFDIEGFCRFGVGCDYYHQEHSKINSEINVKVENLEKTVNAMALKIKEL